MPRSIVTLWWAYCLRAAETISRLRWACREILCKRPKQCCRRSLAAWTYFARALQMGASGYMSAAEVSE
jgi:hypothetical protein